MMSTSANTAGRNKMKIGRPKLPKGEAKGRILNVRVNSDEVRRITKAARAGDQTVSEWIRSAINAATRV
jgi:uncharacterized protein (DUF1778 family)